MSPEKKAEESRVFSSIKDELEDVSNRLSKLILFFGSAEARKIDSEELSLFHMKADHMFRLQQVLSMQVALSEREQQPCR